MVVVVMCGVVDFCCLMCRLCSTPCNVSLAYVNIGDENLAFLIIAILQTNIIQNGSIA